MTTEQWLQWWRDRASTYFTDKVWRFSRPDLVQRLNIRLDVPVLELGFGYGRELFRFCELSDSVFGLELDDWTIAATSQELQKMGVRKPPVLARYDGVTLPFPNSFFGVVYSCFVTQHVSRESAACMLAEAIRVCQPDGAVLFEYFGDPECQSNEHDRFSGNPDDGGMYNNAYSREQVEELGNRFGVIKWIEPWPITKEWGNWWLCVQPRCGGNTAVAATPS